jgi:hypothetical protein
VFGPPATGFMPKSRKPWIFPRTCGRTCRPRSSCR